jgi:hypothetical protein
MISGSHNGGYKDGYLLGCSDMYSGRSFTDIPEVHDVSVIREISFMEAINTSETSVNFYHTTYMVLQFRRQPSSDLHISVPKTSVLTQEHHPPL